MTITLLTAVPVPQAPLTAACQGSRSDTHARYTFYVQCKLAHTPDFCPSHCQSINSMHLPMPPRMRLHPGPAAHQKLYGMRVLPQAG